MVYGLNAQVDYENDLYTAALLNEELNEVVPIRILDLNPDDINLMGANIVSDQYNGSVGIECIGSL